MLSGRRRAAGTPPGAGARAASCAGLLLVLAGCTLQGPPDAGPPSAGPSSAAGATVVPGPAPGPPGTAGPAGAGATPTGPAAAPTSKLPLLSQPKTPYPTPKMPPPPAATSAELSRVEYGLERLVWQSIGSVDPGTRTSCTLSAATLAAVGTHSFGCTVAASGVATPFRVHAKVTATKVLWSYTAAKLPLSATKASYEVTRQAFRPAKVSCAITGVRLVPVGDPTGVSCLVTSSSGLRVRYDGRLLGDGVLVFAQATRKE